jgi:hypothetical protein
LTYNPNHLQNIVSLRKISFPLFHPKEKVEIVMDNANLTPGIKDKGGRRLEILRRRFFTLGHRAERRSSQERRRGQDRRTQNDPGMVSYPRRSMDRYMEFVNAHKGLTYGLLFSLPIWVVIILFLMGKLSF